MTITSTATRRPSTGAAHIISQPRRPEPHTTSWEDRSACYNRPEAWWDGDDPKLTDKARGVCRACPTFASCLGQVMQAEASLTWSRWCLRGGLTGPERTQLFIDEREHGPYDAEEARILALESLATSTAVADLAGDEVSMSTVRLAARLAGEKVEKRKPPTVHELRGGSARERAFERADDIMRWLDEGMSRKKIAARLGMHRRAIHEVVDAYQGMTVTGGDEVAVA
jgi:hypothetical protein